MSPNPYQPAAKCIECGGAMRPIQVVAGDRRQLPLIYVNPGREGRWFFGARIEGMLEAEACEECRRVVFRAGQHPRHGLDAPGGEAAD